MPEYFPEQTAAASGLRVLIVEDSESDAELMVRALKQGAFELSWARVETADAFEAKLSSEAWDVILADFHLPGFSGADALEIVKCTGLDIPLIVVSGTVSEETAVETLKSGAADVVMKGNLARLVPAIERAMIDAAARRQSRLQSAALNAAANAIVITNAEGQIECANLAFTELTGYEVREIIGGNLRLLKSGRHDRAFYERLWNTVKAGNVWRGEMFNRRKDGTLYIEETQITPVRDERGQVAHFIAVKQDVTQRRQGEDRLRESEQKYRELFENLTDAAFVAEMETGMLVDCNRQAEILMGRSREVLLRMRQDELHPPEDAARCRERFAACTSGTQARGFEAEVISANGQRIPVLISTSTLSLRGRGLVLALFADISERKRAQQQIADALSFNETILAASPMGIATYSEAGPCASANQAAAQLLGGTVEELKAQNFRDLGPWQRAGFLDAVERAFETGTEQQVEASYVTTFGKEVWLSIRFNTFQYGGKRHLLVLIADIAQRKRVEEEIRAANERFGRQEDALIALTRNAVMERDEVESSLREIVQTTAMTLEVQRVSVWHVDRDRRKLCCKALYEYQQNRHSSGAELKEDDFPAYFRALAEDDVIAAHDAHSDPRTSAFSDSYLAQTGIDAMLDAPIKLHGRMAGVLCCEHVGGKRRWTSDEQTFAVAVANLVALIFTQEERRRLESQFLRAQRMESIGTLASGVAHDLNNILSPIMMSVPLLRRDLTPEQREEIVSTIEKSADRGAEVVRQVLAFGRGLGGEKHPLQLTTLIKDIIKIMRETFPKNVRIEEPRINGLWPVLGDPTQLHQVLLNLCVNARDAMPDGGVLEISASNTTLDENCASMLPGSRPGPHVLLTVSDTGTGIQPGVLEHIFDPFFTTKGVGKGTGLGLSTVHGIIKDHGGTVDVTTALGKGTTFNIYLPVAHEHEIAQSGESMMSAPRGRGELVLVVDDEAGITTAVRRALEAYGYRVMHAADGTEAIAEFARHLDDVSLMLTDLMMPFMDGIALIRAVRRIKPQLPVIAMSGLGEGARIAELKTLGVQSLLNKPFHAPLLLEAVHEALHSGSNA